jgi:5'-nucleotidase
MNNKRAHILITNDDGIQAEGIRHLWEALVDHADLTIVAPATEKSAVGSGITVRDPLHIHPVQWDRGTEAWKVSGTPADCVRLASSVIIKKPIDLIVSGINKGSNSGRTVLFSGTVGGVIEGTLRNLPGIAFSCVNFVNPDYGRTHGMIASLVDHCLTHPLPKGTLLNVNFPETKEMLGMRWARQGKGYWIEDPEKREHPEGHSYYWLGGKWHDHDEDEESDVHLLKKGYAAVVPIHVNEMTDHALFASKKESFNALFSPSSPSSC